MRNLKATVFILIMSFSMIMTRKWNPNTIVISSSTTTVPENDKKTSTDEKINKEKIIEDTLTEKSNLEILSKKEIEQEIQSRKKYSDEDLSLLAHIINAEQGIEFDDEEKTNKLQIYTGQVVLNRIKQNYRGATTIEEVLYTPGQYACISDCSWDNPVSERAYKNAEILLSEAPYWDIYDIPKMPEEIIFQAEFTQGSDIWMIVGDTYFCYK